MALLAQGGPAWALCDLLRGVRDRTKDARLGAVAAGKLLARKRPRLIPVWDHVVRCALGHPNGAWLWLDNLLRAEGSGHPASAGRSPTPSRTAPGHIPAPGPLT